MLTIPIFVLFIHLVADFFCQTDWMGSNKSKDWRALTTHVLSYALVFWIWLGWGAWKFVAVTFVTHFITDAITSRLSGHFFVEWYHDMFNHLNPNWYSRWNVFYQPPAHWFFVVIGCDQFIHFATLAWTWKVLHGS